MCLFFWFGVARGTWQAVKDPIQAPDPGWLAGLPELHQVPFDSLLH